MHDIGAGEQRAEQYGKCWLVISDRFSFTLERGRDTGISVALLMKHC